MRKIVPLFFAAVFLLPIVANAAPLTQEQSLSLINVVRSSPETPASAFTDLITAFSNITINQAESLIGVVQASPDAPSEPYVNMLVAFTEDTSPTEAPSPQESSETGATNQKEEVSQPSSIAKPEITQFESSDYTADLGDEITLTWKSNNAVTCAITETRDISVPFTGRLPSGTTSFELVETTHHKIPEFKYYAICADKDWNTDVEELSITINPPKLIRWELNDAYKNVSCDIPTIETTDKRVIREANEGYEDYPVVLGGVSGVDGFFFRDFDVDTLVFENKGNQSLKELAPRLRAGVTGTDNYIDHEPTHINDSTIKFSELENFGGGQLVVNRGGWESGKEIQIEITQAEFVSVDSTNREVTSKVPVAEESQPGIVMCKN